MSKKAAEGLTALTLDVKVGKAALLTDETAARQLAQTLVMTSSVLSFLAYCRDTALWAGQNNVPLHTGP